MGGISKTLNCAFCGKPLVLIARPDGKGPLRPTCLHCEEADPITSPEVARWFAGELQPPKG